MANWKDGLDWGGREALGISKAERTTASGRDDEFEEGAS
jgi:hypothetical protein